MEPLELYEKAVATMPGIKRKGKKIPYTSVNGHMFSFLDKKGSMGLRLSKDDLDEFLKKFDTKLEEQYGRIMKEYAVVPMNLLEDTETLSQYLEKSYAYVSSLKPKQLKKKKN